MFTATQIHNLNIGCEEITCNNLTQNIGATVNDSLLVCAIQLAFRDSCMCHVATVSDTLLFVPVVVDGEPKTKTSKRQRRPNLQISPCFMKCTKHI